MNCHICEQKTQSFIDEETHILYYHCKACEYIFKSPKYYHDFNSQKKRYNLHTNNENDIGYIAYFQRFLDFVLPKITLTKDKTIKALDFGCGASSILSTMLKKEGIACDYYDPIYHPVLDEMKKYRLIVSIEVFEHLHQPREVFSGLVNRLDKDGYLAIQTQFHSNDIATFKKWYYHQDPTHIVFFTIHTFSVLAEQYGCEIITDNAKNIIILQKRK
jgi:2-polyprenyl-3-methyl-5-hydroxy-6-metoxy-1,4-benzoquinol methylase